MNSADCLKDPVNWMLTTMTSTGGASRAPYVATGAFQTKALCEAGAQAAAEMFAEMSRTNLVGGGRSQRDILGTKCIPAANAPIHILAAKKN